MATIDGKAAIVVPAEQLIPTDAWGVMEFVDGHQIALGAPSKVTLYDGRIVMLWPRNPIPWTGTIERVLVISGNQAWPVPFRPRIPIKAGQRWLGQAMVEIGGGRTFDMGVPAVLGRPE